MGVKHLCVKKGMSFNEQLKTKWREQFRKSIGYYEPIISLDKLFKETRLMELERINNYV